MDNGQVGIGLNRSIIEVFKDIRIIQVTSPCDPL